MADKPSNSSGSNINNYLIGAYSYPDGLGNSDDLKHYITFSINVRGKTKFNYVTAGQAPASVAGSRRNNIDLSKTGSIINDNQSGLVFGAGLLLGVGAAYKQIKGKAGSSTNKIAGAAEQAGTTLTKYAAVSAAAAAAVTAIGVDLTKAGSILSPDKTYRLKDTITLHVQERPTVTYGINYQDKDMGILGGLLTGDASMSDLSNGNAGEFSTAAALQIAKIPSLLPGGSGATLSEIIQLGAKIKTNPFREVFFEGIDYRKFNFRYKFMPKSAKESTVVYKIIELFKEHMHPELSANGYFYTYPSEFNIEYYYNNKKNNYVNKIATCALTDMSVEYGGEQYATFADGSPAEINLILSFRELELMTKETIRKGY